MNASMILPVSSHYWENSTPCPCLRIAAAHSPRVHMVVVTRCCSLLHDSSCKDPATFSTCRYKLMLMTVYHSISRKNGTGVLELEVGNKCLMRNHLGIARYPGFLPGMMLA